MKITSISIFGIKLPLIDPFIISYETYTTMPSVIVKVETDQGVVGYGEGVADEHVTGETWESIFQVLKHTLAPAVIGENPFHLEKIHEIMDRSIYQSATAKAAIDIACHDIMGKAVNQPIYNLLGGRYHERFPLSHVLSIQEPDVMAEEAAQAVEKGYQILKMKVGIDRQKDVKRIKTVRQRVGEDIRIRVDANQGWKTSADSLDIIKKIENEGVEWIEQPVVADDIDALAEVKQKAHLPLMIDEGLKGTREMRDVISKRAADKVNIKLMKCGGIYSAVNLVHQASMARMSCQVGSMVESSVGSAAGFHVAFAKKDITSVELTGPLKFAKDIGSLPYDVPFIELRDRPGLGIDVDERILEELTEMYDKVESR